jgi:hypothetical protein
VTKKPICEGSAVERWAVISYWFRGGGGFLFVLSLLFGRTAESTWTENDDCGGCNLIFLWCGTKKTDHAAHLLCPSDESQQAGMNGSP